MNTRRKTMKNNEFDRQNGASTSYNEYIKLVEKEKELQI